MWTPAYGSGARTPVRASRFASRAFRRGRRVGGLAHSFAELSRRPTCPIPVPALSGSHLPLSSWSLVRSRQLRLLRRFPRLFDRSRGRKSCLCRRRFERRRPGHVRSREAVRETYVARSVTAAGALGPIRPITPDEYSLNFGTIDADMDTSGDAAFVWLEEASNRDILVNFRTLSAAGVLSPVVTLDRFAQSEFHVLGWPQVEVDAAGNSIVVWVGEAPAAAPLDAIDLVRSRRISAAGVPGPTKVLATQGVVGDRGGIGRLVPYPRANTQLAVNGSGAAVVGWLRMQYDSHITSYETRTISPAGVPGPVRTIRTLDDRTDVAARDVQVGLDSTGDAVFSWTRDGIEARTFTGENRLGPIQKLSTLGSDSALAMDPARMRSSSGRETRRSSRRGEYPPPAWSDPQRCCRRHRCPAPPSNPGRPWQSLRMAMPLPLGAGQPGYLCTHHLEPERSGPD